jgi:hypothetical protein
LVFPRTKQLVCEQKDDENPALDHEKRDATPGPASRQVDLVFDLSDELLRGEILLPVARENQFDQLHV